MDQLEFSRMTTWSSEGEISEPSTKDGSEEVVS